MHFGYRVFDEIIMFLKNAEENHMENAFDQAVLMKVLPKFHGSRGKLAKPLESVLKWCDIQKSGENAAKYIIDPELDFLTNSWRFPATAQRVVRMLQSLQSTGFASFG